MASSRARTLSLGAASHPALSTDEHYANATGANEQDEDEDPYTSDPRLSPIEAQILLEYKKLLRNLRKLSARLAEMSAQPSTNIADGLRTLERKTTLVHTALKSSVYSIVLQQQIEYSGVDGNSAAASRQNARDEDDDDTARLG